MIKVKPLFKYKTEELVPLAGDLVVDFYETGEVNVLRDVLQGEETVHKIYLIFHLMEGLNSRNWELEQKIQRLNDKIRDQGKELSKLKRANTSNT